MTHAEIVKLAGGKLAIRKDPQKLALLCAVLHTAGASFMSLSQALGLTQKKVRELAQKCPKDKAFWDYREDLGLRVHEHDQRKAKRRSSRGRKAR